MTSWIQSRLPLVSGTHLEATVLVAETTVNELVRIATQRDVTVEVLEQNGIVVRYGVFQARAILPAHLDPGPSPRLSVSLSSTMVALALRAALRQPFISIHGRRVTIDLAAIPPLAEWRELWRYLAALDLSTNPGLVRARFRLAIDQGAPHA